MALSQLPVDPVTVLDWAPYTPSNSNITIGDGTQLARFARVGNTIYFTYSLTFGSTTSFSGNPQVGLPVNANASILVAGPAYAIDANGNNFIALTYLASATQVRAVLDGQASTGAMSATVPFTWASGDILLISGTYEAA